MRFRRRSRRGVLVALSTVATAAIVGVAAPSAGAKPGFVTSQGAMLTPLAAGASAEPIITVGETLKSGYRFEAIPDGISLIAHGKGTAEVFVNHETSTFPFPFVPAAPTITNSQNDFDNAQLSRLKIHQKSMGVLSGEYAIPSSAAFQRFCSNFLAGRAEGFNPRLLFTNEEASDFVNRSGGLAWPPGPSPEQAGVVVAYDPDTGDYRKIYGLGRMNHENTVAIPGYGHPVLLTDDDTFSAPSSQLYMYLANSRDAVWNDQGHLWAFVPNNPLINDYGDLNAVTPSVVGHFIQVPDPIARGDQGPLESWSNANNVFQFIRLEDIAYDRNDNHVVYLADTGEPRAIPGGAGGRLMRGPSGTMGPYPNGRIFKLELNDADPTQNATLSILINADPAGPGVPSVLHQPDNLETTKNSLLVQEDPGSHNQFAPGAGPNARIWRYDLQTAGFTPVAQVNQTPANSAINDPAARAGQWESSGIVDASAAFGPGAFLVDVQAHCPTAPTPLAPCPAFVETAPGPDIVPPAGPDWLFKREGGQLLLFRLPGA